MLDLHTREFGYTEVSPPLLVNRESLVGTGQLPKFEEELFKVEGEVSFSFRDGGGSGDESPPGRDPDGIASAGLCGLYAVLPAGSGSYGRDTRGLICQHQFDKVELVRISRPEESYDELERLVRPREEVLERPRPSIPRRRALHPGRSGILGGQDVRYRGLDAGAGGRGRSTGRSPPPRTASQFQARRASIRYRPAGKKGTEFVHTLNGSGLAVGHSGGDSREFPGRGRKRRRPEGPEELHGGMEKIEKKR